MKPILPYFILISLSALSIIGCKAPEIITNTITKDSVIYREVPKYIEVPGSEVQAPPINLDSLKNLIQKGIKPEVINRTMVYTDTSGNINLRLILDQLGNLTAVCETQQQRIQYLESQVEYFKSISTQKEVINEKTFWQKFEEKAAVVISTLVVSAIVFFLFKLLKR